MDFLGMLIFIAHKSTTVDFILRHFGLAPSAHMKVAFHHPFRYSHTYKLIFEVSGQNRQIVMSTHDFVLQSDW